MPEITNLIFCINAEKIVSDNGSVVGVNAMNVQTVLTPEFIPGTLSFSIVFFIQDLDYLHSATKIQVRFLDPEKKVVSDSGELVVPQIKEDPSALNLPQKYKGINLTLELKNMVFETEGEYTTEIMVNGDTLLSKPIYVKARRRVLNDPKQQ